MISRIIARWTVGRSWVVALAMAALAVLSAWVIASREAFDSDILNLLPGEHPAVRGLKLYNSDFPQTRELAFLLSWDDRPDDIEAARETFIGLLRRQPWVHRILDGPPLESESGRATMHEFLAALTLNLPPAEFAETVAALAPERIGERIRRLATQTAAGSPRARFELENDPLGVAGRAARPVWETVSISTTFDLTSPDGTATIVPVITSQADVSPDACRRLMAEVRKFLEEARKTMPAAQIGVTGRSAYVEEIADSMRNDITKTSLVSLACVTALFWAGFRKLLPLAGIALILALTALVTLACGTLVFDRLNVVAISFCSILFGLGDDFSLLLVQRFYQFRGQAPDREAAISGSIRHCAPGILWVAFTTGIGFLALCFGGSVGFAQLGAMVAIGVILCAVFMPAFLFLFVRDVPGGQAEPEDGFWRRLGKGDPRRMLALGASIFLPAALIAVSPWRPLAFDISPASLEPRNIPAAKTLSRMMEKFPATFEPIMVVLPHPEAKETRALDQALKRLEQENLLEASSSPSALLIDPSRMAANAAVPWDAGVTRKSFEDALSANGLDPAQFGGSIALLESLRGFQNQGAEAMRWSRFLSSASPWWFVLDRMISPDSGAAIAYAKAPRGANAEDRARITDVLQAAAPAAFVTGWSQTLAALIPWARRELAVFGGSVAVVVLVILALLYRDARLWMLHAGSLAAAGAGVIATVKALGVPINLLNVLAFPLMLGVGVDYGIHLILAVRERGELTENLTAVLKPIVLSGLTTATGFGSLALAQNPSLSGLGTLCGIGVAWCLLAALLIVGPGAVWLAAGSRRSPG